MPDLTQLVNPLQNRVPQAGTSTAIPPTASILIDDSPERNDATLKNNIADFWANKRRAKNSNYCRPVMEEQPKKKEPNALWTREEVIQHLQEEGMTFLNTMGSFSPVIAMTLPGMNSDWEFEGNHFMVELRDADPHIVSMDGLRTFIADNNQILGKEMIDMMAEIRGFEDLLELIKPSKEEQEQQKSGVRFVNDLDGSEVESIKFPGMKPNGKLQGNYFTVNLGDGGSERIAIDKLREYIEENRKALGPWILYKICEVIGIEDIRDLCDLSSKKEEIMVRGAQRPNRFFDNGMPDDFFTEVEMMPEGEEVESGYGRSPEQRILFSPQKSNEAKRGPVIKKQEPPKKTQTFSEQSKQSEHMDGPQKIGRARMRL